MLHHLSDTCGILPNELHHPENSRDVFLLSVSELTRYCICLQDCVRDSGGPLMVSLEGWMPPSTAGLGKDKPKQRSSGAAGATVSSSACTCSMPLSCLSGTVRAEIKAAGLV
jgi:hypothetical protein